MSAVCPNGHTSESTDYCDTCGSPIPEGAATPGQAPAAATPPPTPSTGGNSLDLPPVPGAEGSAGAPSGPKPCPNCATPNTQDSLFCEACGYDFTTGALPAGAAAVSPEAEPAELSPPEAAAEPAAPEPGAGLDRDAGLDPDAGPDPGSGGDPDAGLDAGAGVDPGSGPDPLAGAEPSETGAPAPDGGAGEDLAAEEAAPAGAGAASSPGTGVPPRIPFQWVAEVWIDPDWYADQEAEEPLPSAGLPVVVPLRIASALIGRKSASRNIAPDIDCSADPGVSRRHAQLTTDGSRWFIEDLQSSNGTFVGPASGPLPEEPIAVGPKTEVGDNRIYVGAWTRIVVRRATDEEIAIG